VLLALWLAAHVIAAFSIALQIVHQVAGRAAIGPSPSEAAGKAGGPVTC
jgi:hypothetical protein